MKYLTLNKGIQSPHSEQRTRLPKLAVISMLDDTKEQYHFSFGWCEEQTKRKWSFVLYVYTHTHTHKITDTDGAREMALCS